ncbi:hypothetical protein REPUB_Repub06bG0183100 [Reevesia pubescens]
MKLLSKPISSPGRTEKYPPPLMRVLRSNVGSRSRGRSRSSPMFVRKKNIAIETQEPTSPKVTCMGQVRVKRSKQTGSAKPGRPGAPTCRRNRCKWIRNALFCNHFPGKVKAKPFFRPSWKKWGTFFHMESCRKSKTGEDSSKFRNIIEGSVEENEEDEEEEEESEENEKEAKIFVSSFCSSPPKNALILTRCRSAPYRSSSLACRFWGSPLANQETEGTELENRGFKEEERNPTPEKESICRNSDQDSKMNSETEEKPGFCNELKEKKIEKTENNEELKKAEHFGNVRPLILTRCKSEPARTAERLNPEMSFWKKRRLGIT